MNGWLVRAVCIVVRAWTAIYTLPLEQAAQRARQAEIDSDLWEFLHDDSQAGEGFATVVHILAGALLAVPDDLLWICEQLPRHRRRPSLSAILRCAIVVVAASGLAVSASGPTLDVASAVRVTVVSAGWMAVATRGTEVMLVPAIALSVTNAGDRPTGALQLNAVFSTAGPSRAGLGTAFSPLVGWRGLKPGTTSGVVIMRGHSPLLVDTTELERRARRSSLNVDASRVDLLVQHEGHWTRIGDVPIPPRVIQP
ncbi:MAG TPA: hypothetical protein VKE51_19900 [Vicinamibacterales bacterium]|nr:hypothetical protein [Vicinamibacterales bacterium]